MFPYTQHQYIKYSHEGKQYNIKGVLQPFSLHEVSIYEDISYYLPKNLKLVEEEVKEKEKIEKKKRKHQSIMTLNMMFIGHLLLHYKEEVECLNDLDKEVGNGKME